MDLSCNEWLKSVNVLNFLSSIKNGYAYHSSPISGLFSKNEIVANYLFLAPTFYAELFKNSRKDSRHLAEY